MDDAPHRTATSRPAGAATTPPAGTGSASPLDPDELAGLALLAGLTGLSGPTGPEQVAPPGSSVFGALIEEHPEVEVQRLRKSTLLALSWALEEEMCARATRPVLVGAFQQARFLDEARERWGRLAARSRHTYVLGVLGATGSRPAGEAFERVDLDEDHPMRDEWAVVCDAVDLPVALAAVEAPGQDGVPDRDRLFDAVWTIEPAAVRTAARAAAQAALEHGSGSAAPMLYHLADAPRPTVADPVASSRVFARLIGYVDQAARA